MFYCCCCISHSASLCRFSLRFCLCLSCCFVCTRAYFLLFGVLMILRSVCITDYITFGIFFLDVFCVQVLCTHAWYEIRVCVCGLEATRLNRVHWKEQHSTEHTASGKTFVLIRIINGKNCILRGEWTWD